ncbi:hypothetical protein F5Y12DRAFT_717832 [Xylaria sp. FL1777]|nr:hypothetical protein F5Y12DRAFT_717832 [Xylaria sp. FL1777]
MLGGVASLVACLYVDSLAILCVLALAFKPFSQQLLRFDERVIAYPEQQSSVPFSTVYDFGGQDVDGASAVIGKITPASYIRSRYMAVTVNGVYAVRYSEGSTIQLSDFHHPERCSECEDITSTIKKTGENVAFGQLWSFCTPSNLTLEASVVSDAHSGFSHTLSNATSDAVHAEFTELRIPIRITIIQFPNNQSTDRSKMENWMDTVPAYECKFSFCAVGTWTRKPPMVPSRLARTRSSS